MIIELDQTRDATKDMNDIIKAKKGMICLDS